MKIIFTPEAEPVSDYKVEEVYQDTLSKGLKELHTCNDMLLTRFRVGVKEGDIEELTVIMEDIDGTIFEETSTDGVFCKLWNAEITNLFMNLSMRIM